MPVYLCERSKLRIGERNMMLEEEKWEEEGKKNMIRKTHDTGGGGEMGGRGREI